MDLSRHRSCGKRKPHKFASRNSHCSTGPHPHTHRHSEQHIHIRIPIHICLMPDAWPLIRAQSNKEREREKGGGDLGGKIKMQNSLLFNIFDGAWLRPVSVFSLLYGNCPPALDDKQPQGREQWWRRIRGGKAGQASRTL